MAQNNSTRQLSSSAKSLYEAFLKREHARPDHWFWGNQASSAFDTLTRIWTEDAAYELIFSGLLKGCQLIELCRYGGDAGTVSKAYNRSLWGLNRRLRERKPELPGDFQSYLDWLLQTHDY